MLDLIVDFDLEIPETALSLETALTEVDLTLTVLGLVQIAQEGVVELVEPINVLA